MARVQVVWECGDAMRNWKERQNSPLPAGTEGWKKEQRGVLRKEDNEI